MITFPTIFHAITNVLTVKLFKSGTNPAQDTSKAINDGFWGYTEQNGKADVSSFKGLL